MALPNCPCKNLARPFEVELNADVLLQASPIGNFTKTGMRRLPFVKCLSHTVSGGTQHRKMNSRANGINQSTHSSYDMYTHLQSQHIPFLDRAPRF
jgi:hypothetical protein